MATLAIHQTWKAKDIGLNFDKVSMDIQAIQISSKALSSFIGEDLTRIVDSNIPRFTFMSIGAIMQTQIALARESATRVTNRCKSSVQIVCASFLLHCPLYSDKSGNAFIEHSSSSSCISRGKEQPGEAQVETSLVGGELYRIQQPPRYTSSSPGNGAKLPRIL